MRRKITWKACLVSAVLVCGLLTMLIVGLFFYQEHRVTAQLAGDDHINIMVDGQQRSFYVHLPPTADGVTEWPMVIVFHGGGGNAANAAMMSHMSDIADKNGFIAVYPNGSGRFGERLLTWNNTVNCCGYAFDKDVDDVAFVDAMLDYLIIHYPIDPTRIYATGMSNGGMLTYLLACTLADRLAAVAPVAGAMNNLDDCQPTGPMPMMILHGTADKNVRYAGGEPIETMDNHARVDRSVADAVDFWTTHNACMTPATTTRVDHIETTTYTDCASEADVVLVTIIDGGHAWPGGQRGSILGDLPSNELDASQAMWDFFKRYSRGEAVK